MFNERYSSFENTRFNRYMVECESHGTSLSVKSAGSFNRYMVECECIITYATWTTLLVLIDTWWNVNEVSKLQRNCKP